MSRKCNGQSANFLTGRPVAGVGGADWSRVANVHAALVGGRCRRVILLDSVRRAERRRSGCVRVGRRVGLAPLDPADKIAYRPLHRTRYEVPEVGGRSLVRSLCPGRPIAAPRSPTQPHRHARVRLVRKGCSKKRETTAEHRKSPERHNLRRRRTCSRACEPGPSTPSLLEARISGLTEATRRKGTDSKTDVPVSCVNASRGARESRFVGKSQESLGTT